MPSGGARMRSGPPADPNALRRDRADDGSWVDLPASGRKGRTPKWPLADQTPGEKAMWAKLWRKPQAVEWERLDLVFEVAAYTRAALQAVAFDASAGLKTAVLRMSAELGLSTVGMGQLRWRIVLDDVTKKRQEAETVAATPTAPASARDRIRLLNG